MTRRAAVMMLLAALASCGGDDGGGGDAVDAAPACAITSTEPAATVPLAGACPLAQRLGGFTVADSGTYSSIQGLVADAVIDATVPEVLMTEGDCALHRRANPFCDPACSGEETCSSGGVCVPFPGNVDLGPVEVRAAAGCTTMAARPPGNNYFATDVAHPYAAAGVLLELAAGAGPLGPVLLHGVGVDSLPAGDPAWTVTRGQVLPITWPAATAGARSRVVVRVQIDQHGLAPASIVCDTADDGSLDIPATLVDALFAAGVSGFPNGGMVRRTVDSVSAGAGCVEFVVASERSADITVAP